MRARHLRAGRPRGSPSAGNSVRMSRAYSARDAIPAMTKLAASPVIRLCAPRGNGVIAQRR